MPWLFEPGSRLVHLAEQLLALLGESDVKRRWNV